MFHRRGLVLLSSIAIAPFSTAVADHVSVAPGAAVSGVRQSASECSEISQRECRRSTLQDSEQSDDRTRGAQLHPIETNPKKVACNERSSFNCSGRTGWNDADIGFAVPENGDLLVLASNSSLDLPSAAKEPPKGDLKEARAYWVSQELLAWSAPTGASVSLHHSRDASLSLTGAGVTGGAVIVLEPAGVIGGDIASKFPHLSGLATWRIPASEKDKIPQILKAQFVLSALSANGKPIDATGVQPAGALDDLYTYDGPLGVTFSGKTPTVRVWAPTAQSVKLQIFDEADNSRPAAQELPMAFDTGTGVWSITGNSDWNRKFYRFEVTVFARSTGRIEVNSVTDPYSVSLSMNGQRSQIVNLDDKDLKPRGWDNLVKPELDAPEDQAIYELHVRDFSINDASVAAMNRGAFRAFAKKNTVGMKHLRALAEAGLTTVHLLPAFDCASVNEDRSAQAAPGDLSGFGPDSEEQQAAVFAVREQDGFNWCYDPQHYTAPEGSYSTDPNGPARIKEFREMVAGLQRAGLRVVMDVVYNHTSASLQAPNSVLDRIVPDYYHRLNSTGYVETSTCCANTATEHNMMEKLMLDSLETWVRAYKIDGFRFDLMGHHTKANNVKARDLLQAIDPSIYLYGEGWNFGEVSNNARFVQATQANMGGGSGVGTFNDRLRDTIRGGGPFDDPPEQVSRQGFANGLWYDPNGANAGSESERQSLLLHADRVRVGLAGSLSNYPFTDRNGASVTGAMVDYNGSPAGYVSDPQETINYIAAHDNETLFDVNQLKMPADSTPTERARVQAFGNAIVALAQGVPFFHAGQEMLRSKSMDRNSYNSGDWFNVLDFTYATNGFRRGLPPEQDNGEMWPTIRPILADPGRAVTSAEIDLTAKMTVEFLKIRQSSPLFRLRTASEIIDNVEFHNTGPSQLPGVIVMSLKGAASAEIVVVFNATTAAVDFPLDLGGDFDLHPVQQQSADEVVRGANYNATAKTFNAPARTAAVFVRR